MNVLIKEHRDVIPAIITALGIITEEPLHFHHAQDWPSVPSILERAKIDIIILGVESVSPLECSLVNHLIDLAITHEGAPVIALNHSLDDDPVCSFEDMVFYINKQKWNIQAVMGCFKKAVLHTHNRCLRHQNEISLSA